MFVFNEDNCIKPRPYILHGLILLAILAAIALIPLN